MADPENFDLDIYGDEDDAQNSTLQDGNGSAPHEHDHDSISATPNTAHPQGDQNAMDDTDYEQQPNGEMSYDGPADSNYPEQDERPVDANASTAVIVSDLQWWTTDDDIRGWLRACGSEDEVKEMTFSEHKVNGKSKGQLYLEFSSPQASTAIKNLLESPPQATDAMPHPPKRHSVLYSNPTSNPFRTLPKDAPNRVKDSAPVPGGRGGFQPGGGSFRGRGAQRGGGFKGGFGQQGGGQGFMGNGGFQPRGGFNNGFGGPRGGRGGRGGMPGMPMGMPMMGMPGMMPGMGMGMGMPGGGFGGQGGGFNPAFFNGQQGGNMGMGMGMGMGGQGGEWNPHGNKRPRPE